MFVHYTALVLDGSREMDSSFLAKFCFKPEYRGYLGIERECFLTDDGKVTPRATSILELLPSGGTYGYELSACQLEMRTKPSLLMDLYVELEEIQSLAEIAARELGLELRYIPVAPEDMPIDVYPDPTGRYARIVEMLPHPTLVAACRVAAVHIHLGVRDPDEAIDVYNRLVEHFDELKSMGNTCNGQRLALYRLMASDATPQTYASWEEYCYVMQAKGYIEDPRQCWDMIRISTHGTIEVRVFDSVPDIKRIVNWAETIFRLSGIVL